MTQAYFFVVLSYGIVAVALVAFGVSAILARKKFVAKLRDEGFLD